MVLLSTLATSETFALSVFRALACQVLARRKCIVPSSICQLYTLAIAISCSTTALQLPLRAPGGDGSEDEPPLPDWRRSCRPRCGWIVYDLLPCLMSEANPVIRRYAIPRRGRSFQCMHGLHIADIRG